MPTRPVLIVAASGATARDNHYLRALLSELASGQAPGSAALWLGPGPDELGLGDVLPTFDVTRAWGQPPLLRWRRLRAGWLGPRLKALVVRRWLGRRRNAVAYLSGTAAAGALPWLARHRGPVVLHVRDGDPGLAAGAGVPTALIDRLLLTEPSLIDGEPPCGVRPEQVLAEPGWQPTPPPERPPRILVLGAPDRAHGVDLVGRVLWATRGRLARAGASVVWNTGEASPTIPSDDAADFDRLGVTGMISWADGTLDEASDWVGVTALLQVPRPGGSPLPPAWLEAAAAAAVPVISFGPSSPDAAAPGATTPGSLCLPFGDAEAAAAGLVAIVEARPTAPPRFASGLSVFDDLVDHPRWRRP